MKTFFLPALRVAGLLAGLGAAQSAAAQSPARPQPVCVDQMGAFSYLVRVSNPSRQPGEVQLVNLSDNTVLYQQYSRGSVFGQRLNVRELPDGQYALRVKVGKASFNYALDIHSTRERTVRLGSVSTNALAAAD